MDGEGNRADALKTECGRKKEKRINMESFSEGFRGAFLFSRAYFSAPAKKGMTKPGIAYIIDSNGIMTVKTERMKT